MFFETLFVSLISGTAPKIIDEARKSFKSLTDRIGGGSMPDNDDQESPPAIPEPIDILQDRVDVLESSLIDQAELVSQMAEQGQALEMDLNTLAKRVNLLLFGTVITFVLAITAIVIGLT